MTDYPSGVGPTLPAVIKESRRINPEGPDEVRHIRLQVIDPGFRYLEGQSIGVVVPGPHPFGNPLHLRRYSIANARELPLEEGVDLELLVRRCFYIDEVSGERYPGIASNFLCDARPGDRIQITGPYASPFKMPQDHRSNLLMISTGTGVAPFRAFMQSIYERRSGWSGQVRLFYGARTGLETLYRNDRDTDFANYYDEKTFRAFQALIPRRTTDEEAALQRSLEDNASEVWDLVQQPNTYVFLAGLERTAVVLERILSQAAGSESAWLRLKGRLLEDGRWSELLYS